jgi:hypothetical protein
MSIPVLERMCSLKKGTYNLKCKVLEALSSRIRVADMFYVHMRYSDIKWNLLPCPPQIPGDLTRDWTWAMVVGSCQLTTCAMAQPCFEERIGWKCYGFFFATACASKQHWHFQQSRADTIQNCQSFSRTWKFIMYICMSFDGELLESTLKPAYKHHRSFTGVLTPIGAVYRFYLPILWNLTASVV